MDTGRQRGKHMKLSLTKFLLDISTKQEIQEKDKVLPWGLEFEKQYRKSIAMAAAVTKNLQKSIITTLVVPLA